MLDHIGLAVADLDRARDFYLAALAPLGIEMVKEQRNDLGHRAVLFGVPGAEPDLALAEGERPGEGNHLAFTAASRQQVEAFHAAALAAGGRDNGAPGLRPHYHPGYYAAFVLDPDGFYLEAVFHDPSVTAD